MRVTFRTKLLLLVGTALLALVVTLIGSALLGLGQSRELAEVEGRLVPRLEVGPRLEAEFERLSRSMQDAVAAQDPDALAATAEHKSRILELIRSAENALQASEAAAIRWAIEEYHDAARDVSERMIAGEAGESLVEDAARMQRRQANARALIKKATVLDRGQIARAFAAVRTANRSADRFRIAIGVLGLLLVALFSFWVGRSTFQVLSKLSEGFKRFATGDFSREIPVTTADELGDVSREANQMAASLRALAEDRARDEWLQTGQVGLSDELRGELEPASVAERALTFLARRIDALAGALYLQGEDGELHLSATYAASCGAAEAGSSSPDGLIQTFREGEGLVGATFASGEALVVDDPPAGYLKIRSGLGGASPRALLFAPLLHFGRKLGVLEFAFLKPCPQATQDLLVLIRATLVVTLEAAKSRAALGLLLAETQEQAERLATQEEELRTNNQELIAQQEELRRANQELEDQRQVLRKQNHELGQAGLRLQEKAEELERVSSYKSQFLANMSHELRTPLNSMLLLSHLLAENESGNLTTKQVEHLQTVHAAGKDLLSLINQVLDLSKIEAGKQDVNLEPVSLEHLRDYARRTFEPLAAERGLSLVVEIEPDLPSALVTDRQHLERILTNLLGNAIKFTEQGRITLAIGRPRPELWLGSKALGATRTIAFSVADTGIGIEPEAQERVFAPFEQVGSAVFRGYAGTGLGLAIARETAHLLGGELFLESQAGKGSVFTCLLPERALPTAVSGDTRPVLDDREFLTRDQAHLLIIEDDPIVAEQLVDLVHARHLKVAVAQSGQEGLALARQLRPLGIILDVKLPDVDGWTVLELLKRDPATRSVPVHFVSSVDAPQRGLALGAVGYLVKPATRAELAGMIQTLVPKDSGSQRILVVEDDTREGESIVALLGKEGLDAEHVLTGEAALQSLARDDFACMILDLGLPSMDGLSLLQTLREQSDLGTPRVVVHTGRALTKQETRQLESYSEAVVLKDGNSAQRLIEEVRLFVGHVRQNLPREQHGLPGSVSNGSLKGITLLIAEDDMRTVYAVSALLQAKGANVLIAETGREALDALDARPDVRAVLMDLMMPEMDGYQAMRQLRQDPRFADLPVIVLTAKAMKGERERCLAAGASDYLSKPIDAEKLFSTLHAWLRRTSSNDSN